TVASGRGSVGRRDDVSVGLGGKLQKIDQDRRLLQIVRYEDVRRLQIAVREPALMEIDDQPAKLPDQQQPAFSRRERSGFAGYGFLKRRKIDPFPETDDR